MNSVMDLWKKRAKDYWNEAIRYLRLIGNSGFLFTIYLAIIIGSYYYSVFLKWLPETFPTSYVLAIVTAYIVTKTRIRTFVKEADIVFLTPLEGKLDQYFKRSLVYSYLFQSFVIVLVMIVLSPLYNARISNESGSILFVIIVLLVAKLWNLLNLWEEQKLQSEQTKRSHFLLRFVVTLSLTILLFTEAPIVYLLAIGGIMLLLTMFYYRPFRRSHSLKWNYLVEMEDRMLTSFYRIANSFTDVPKLKSRVKGRRMISAITNFIPFKQEKTYHYLYSKAFIRSNDYFGIYVRLLIVGSILLIVLPEGFGRLFVFLLVIYMSGLQLSTLWFHHDTKVWLDLYPISPLTKRKSFSDLVFVLLLIKTGVFILTIALTGESLTLLFLTGIIGVLFSYVYAYQLIHKRKKK